MWIQKTPTQLSKNQDTGRRRKVRNLTLTNIALRPTDRHSKGEAQIEGELNLASTKSVLGALWIAEGGKRWQKAAKLERDGDSDRGRSITGSERASEQLGLGGADMTELRPPKNAWSFAVLAVIQVCLTDINCKFPASNGNGVTYLQSLSLPSPLSFLPSEPYHPFEGNCCLTKQWS